MENQAQTLITTLTAVHNGEAFLRQCLDSLLAQTHRNAQFICIDDASTDATPQILQEYAERDSRFEVITLRENIGQAAARNIGLKRAKGEFTAMLDADDWFAPDSLAQALAALQATPEADCALLQLLLTDGNGPALPRPIPRATVPTTLFPELQDPAQWPETFTGPQALFLSLDWRLHGLYLVRTALHQRYPFDTSTRLFSDDNTTRLHFLHSRKVVQSQGRYYYRQHANSATNSADARQWLLLGANLSMKQTLLREAELQPELMPWEQVINYFEAHRWLNLVGLYFRYTKAKQRLSPADRKAAEEQMAAALQTIEPRRICWPIKRKLGYFPVKNFAAFRAQARFYFWLRRLLGKEPK